MQIFVVGTPTINILTSTKGNLYNWVIMGVNFPQYKTKKPN